MNKMLKIPNCHIIFLKYSKGERVLNTLLLGYSDIVESRQIDRQTWYVIFWSYLETWKIEIMYSIFVQQ